MALSALRLLLLLCASAALGLGYARYRGLPLIPDLQALAQEQDARALWVQQTAIELEEFRQHYETGGLVIDARPGDAFEKSHLDALSIMNIPADEAADGYHIDRVLPYQGQPIVLYCASADCESAEILWNVLVQYGFYDVRVYHPGFEGIEKEGLPTVAGPDFLKNNHQP